MAITQSRCGRLRLPPTVCGFECIPSAVELRSWETALIDQPLLVLH